MDSIKLHKTVEINPFRYFFLPVSVDACNGQSIQFSQIFKLLVKAAYKYIFPLSIETYGADEYYFRIGALSYAVYYQIDVIFVVFRRIPNECIIQPELNEYARWTPPCAVSPGIPLLIILRPFPGYLLFSMCFK
jgi:hypothetical protein